MSKINKKNLSKIAIGAGGAALAAGAAAAAGALLANKDLRNALGKKATEALKTVSRLAEGIDKGAREGIRVVKTETKAKKSAPKKAFKKSVKKR